MGCKLLQFPTAGMKLLGDEVAFGEHVKKLGLNIAERHLITSEEEVLVILYPEKLEPSQEKRYTVKSASTNDTTGSEMTLLPLSPPNDIKGCFKTLQPSPSHPLILQESFPNHQQYTVHALISHGKPAAFAAYPTSTTPLTPLSSTSLLTQSFLQYTTLLTTSSLSNPAPTTGHIALLFNLPTPLALSSIQFGASFLSNLCLISCTPSLILGTLAIRDVSEDLAAAYLSILSDHEPKGVSNRHWEERIIVPRSEVRGYYFLGREVVRLGCGRFWV